MANIAPRDQNRVPVMLGVDGSTFAQPTTVAVDETTHKLLTISNVASSGGLIAEVGPRSQTPTGNVLQVQIGPSDAINNATPVFVDWEHHQVHEGETYQADDIRAGIATSTVKYAIVVPTYANVQGTPHMLIGNDVYNGNTFVQLYEGATFTGGSALTAYNRNRNVATTPQTTITGGVTSTNGTLIASFYCGAGNKNAGGTRQNSEWVLKSNTTYRVDVIGKAAGTDVVVTFDWYEDLGV